MTKVRKRTVAAAAALGTCMEGLQ